MEGLYFANEDDPEKESDLAHKKVESKPTPLLEILKDSPKEQKEKTLSRQIRDETKEDNGDQYLELDAEAPLEEASRVERAAIAQTMAGQRLAEVRTSAEKVTSEDLAAESFLEGVEASGDIDQAYNETLIEVGGSALTSLDREEVESELALPTDPEDLAKAARNELLSSTDQGDYLKLSQANRPKETEPPNKTTAENKTQAIDSFVEYLVGRRHGRTTSAEHEEEIAKKLKSEVSELRLELTARESYLRQLARNRRFEKKSSKESPPESLGKMVIKNETAHHHHHHQEKTKAEVAGISAHIMSSEELLAVAEEVSVENTTLKKIFESHMIGEQAMRRVIAEYLRGGDYRATLRREQLEHEKDFERDPKLRDQGSSPSVSQRRVNLDDLLEKTGLDMSESPATSLEPKAKPAKPPVLIQDIVPAYKRKRKRRIADIIMISVIILMTAAVIVLLLRR